MGITVLFFSILFFGLFYFKERKLRLFSFVLVTLNSFLFGLVIYSNFFTPLNFASANEIFFVPNADMLVVALTVTSLCVIPIICDYLFETAPNIRIVHRYQKSSTWLAVTLRILLYLSAFILIFAGFLFLNSCYWALNYFGELDINQIIYTLNQPLEGSSSVQMESFVFGPLLSSALVSSLIWCGLYFLIRYKITSPSNAQESSRSFLRFLTIPIALILTVGNLFLGISAFGFENVKSAFFDKTKLYESYYVTPQTVAIDFPEQKRNLIYIYVESLETTYISSNLGGAQSDNLLPGLSTLALENTNFSNTELLGGALTLPGTNFTAGGLVSQTSGTPLITSINGNEYGGETDEYLPGVYSLGQVLEDNGYQNYFMLGSDITFSGRDKYFSQHCDYEFFDYYYAKEQQWIPEDYSVWWGYEDEKLFEFAKNELDQIASSSAPFNFTMLTADTHFPDGLLTDSTPQLFDSQYANVIHWSDAMLTEFIQYIQQQPYYENTTIILTGDHLSMDTNFFEDLDADYTRTVFNTIINPATTIATEDTKNRQFSSLDMYPTTLAALGATIEGDRLGLGTNLFSGKETLVEEIGYDTMYSELQMRSSYYTKNLMGNTDVDVSISQAGTE
ncbi:LTA synthase family protein [Enterococcus sp. HY326]|uniref:LTA synthase family protein n=1 Tax=Enterococcus sp. HY326 TaxID=2971265 RepID=UPI002240AD8F|nr:LTA synthase family protein [Enterococcus sp. HY326]